MTRCCNLDWMEVHCLEPKGDPHDAEYFRRAGLTVSERDYGTRVYREMFTVNDRQDNPFIEVRRNPYSQGVIGIHDAEETHLRLVNAACYYDDAVLRLQNFLEAFNYTFLRIVRVDICLDFERFDEGDDPAKFLKRYYAHRYAKINQGNITSHGADKWSGQEWNSVSWGSPSSAIGTKFYNKTLELYDPRTATYRKPHIRYAWYCAGLIDDFHSCRKKIDPATTPDANASGDLFYTPTIWRVEFSIRSAVKKWFTIELNGKAKNYQSIRNTLDMYDCREKLVTLFASLSQHYFHFKVVEYEKTKREKTLTGIALSTLQVDRSTKLGSYKEEKKLIRKDRCRDKVLFKWQDLQTTYKVGRDDVSALLGEGAKQQKPYDSLITKLRQYQIDKPRKDVVEACEVIIKAIEGDMLRSDLRNPFSYYDMMALQQALSRKVSGDDTDVAILMREIKALLKLNDKTAIF